MTTTGVRPPFAWLGGKSRLVPWLLPQLPAHRVYVEVFGGAAAVLLAKPPSPLEVYNDVDAGLVGFFRVLRDAAQRAELVRRLALTPYARAEWRECATTWAATDDPVERARRWYVTLQQGFGGTFGAGWGFSCAPDKQEPLGFQRTVQGLDAVAARLVGVQAEQDDFQAIIQRYDGPDTLFFCDPPYLPAPRRDGRYPHELTAADHERLLDLVVGCQGQVLLCGYDAPLYHARLAGWTCRRQVVACAVAGRTRRSGLQGVGQVLATQRRVECLWVKPNSVAQPGLWDTTADRWDAPVEGVTDDDV